MSATICSSPSVSRETEARLNLFLTLLRQWNQTTNLVSAGDAAELRQRHLTDSLRLIPFIGAAQTVADLGSGAGFPGLVIAIATDRQMVLIESNQRKAAFLREAIRVTSATARVAAARIEDITETFDLITARAVAPLNRLLSLVAPRLTATGRCLFLKGRNHADEITVARRDWGFDLLVHSCGSDMETPILEILNITRRAGR